MTIKPENKELPCTYHQRSHLYWLSHNPVYWDKRMSMEEADRAIVNLKRQNKGILVKHI